MNDLANDAGGDDDGVTPRNMVVFNKGFIEINYAGPASKYLKHHTPSCIKNARTNIM